MTKIRQQFYQHNVISFLFINSFLVDMNDEEIYLPFLSSHLFYNFTSIGGRNLQLQFYVIHIYLEMIGEKKN